MRAASKASPQRPVIEISARVLQPYTQFLRENDLQKEEANIRRYEDPDDFPYYLTARADDRYVDDPDGIVLTYAALDCPVTLPAGRQFNSVMLDRSWMTSKRSSPLSRCHGTTCRQWLRS